MRELQKHLDAFEKYFKHKQSGESITESIRLVALECSISENSLYSWKKNFHWDDREAIRATTIRRKVEEQTNSTIIENKAKYLTYYHEVLDKFVKDNSQVEIRNVRDLETVIRGALVLQDEAGEITKQTGQLRYDINDPELRKRVARVVGEIQASQSDEPGD